MMSQDDKPEGCFRAQTPHGLVVFTAHQELDCVSLCTIIKLT